MQTSDSDWVLRRGEQVYRAPDLDTLRAWARAGKVGRHDELWNPAAQAWQPALAVPEIAAILTAPRHCPADGSAMVQEEVHRVTLERCSTCGGLWLDGGELDLIPRAIKEEASSSDYTSGLVMGMILG